MTYISPFDHKDIIAGQGTTALELFEEVGDLDYFLTGVGGGGLVSGCALVCKELTPNCKIIGVEPDAGHDAQMSIEQNKIVSIANQKTLADGASTPHIGHLTLKLMR
jgi:threonine dehydratase